jgi:hypothetical protein
VGDAVALDRVAERADHRLLPDQLGKGLRPVFAGEHAIGLTDGAAAARRFGQVHAEHHRIRISHDPAPSRR